MGSQIIFAGPSKFFTQANKDQPRTLSHAVYSVSRDELNISRENNIIGESEPINKAKISHHIMRNKLDKEDVIEITDFTSPCTSELARVTISVDIDRKNLGVNKSRIRLGSGTKIDKFPDLLVICIFFMSLYFSTYGEN